MEVQLRLQFNALKVNPVLTTLYLSNTRIGPDGAIVTSEALKVNSNALTTLDLHRNMIGDEGAAAIGEALKFNNALKTLSLDVNMIVICSVLGFVLFAFRFRSTRCHHHGRG